MVLAEHSDGEAGEPAPGSVPSLESFCAVRARARPEQGGGRAPAAAAGIPEVSRTPAIVVAGAGPVGRGAIDGGLAGLRGGRSAFHSPSLPGRAGGAAGSRRGSALRGRALARPQSAWERARGRGEEAAGRPALARAPAGHRLAPVPSLPSSPLPRANHAPSSDTRSGPELRIYPSRDLRGVGWLAGGRRREGKEGTESAVTRATGPARRLGAGGRAEDVSTSAGVLRFD